MSDKRYSGILLHPSSLPGNYGIGTLGKNALKWIDFLEKADQKWWQILPLGHTGFGDSPYQCFSSFAGNPLLIDFEKMLEEGLLMRRDFSDCCDASNSIYIDFHSVIQKKYPVLRVAYQRFLERREPASQKSFDNFCEKNASWLEDYALYLEVKTVHLHKPWYQWPDMFKKRDAATLADFQERHKEAIGFHRFCQWIFFKQWADVKQYANKKKIEIIGDIPLYVAYDSADAWALPKSFQFNEDLTPKAVAGVPPDFFSATGQLWGNPLYNWEEMQKDGFQWWIRRVEASLELYDWIRIDHFRGFSAYWAVPYGDKTAVNGKWIPAPGQYLFKALKQHFGNLKIIAEDLGSITPDVLQLRDDFDFPGMKILQYAFFDAHSDDLPHHFTQNCVVYTGTHDNETTVGWYKNLDPETRTHLHTYIQNDGSDIHWKMIRLAWASVANFAIVPMQDLLGLDNTARMNTPGTIGGINWRWQLNERQLSNELVRILNFLTNLFDRNLSKE